MLISSIKILKNMKKLFLLFTTLFASVAASFAGESDNYYIIKDGRLTDNVQIMPYNEDDYDNSNLMRDTVVDGEELIAYIQRSMTFLDVKMQMNTPLDLNENYVLVLEYYIPKKCLKSVFTESNKKPLFIIGFEPDYATIEKRPNAQKCSASVMIDAKYEETDMWHTAEKYVYANPNKQVINGMVFSFGREVTRDIKTYPLIRNYYFKKMDSGVKPFYAESFDGFGFGTNSDFYNEKIEVYLERAEFLGGITPKVSERDSAIAWDNFTEPIILFRDFLPDSLNGQDGSGYYDCELLHALQMEPNRDSVVFENIPLPTGCEKIYSQMLMKMHKNEKRWVIAPEDSAEALTIDVPIRVKFDNSDEIFDLTQDTLKKIWTLYKGELTVPEGATSMNLIFGGMKVAYLVDEVMFSTEEFNGVNDYFSTQPSFAVEAYVDQNGNIVVLNGELIATYNLKGQIATKEDKAIIIVVKNEEGVIASKVMIRK